MSKVRHIDFSPKLSVRYVSGYSQWGYGYVQNITLNELDGDVEVHYSLQESGGTAVVVMPTVENNVITVDVPDFLFAKESTADYKAYAFIYTKGEKSGDTIKKIIMHIDARPKPEGFVFTEDDKRVYDELKDAIDKQAEQSSGHMQNKDIHVTTEDKQTWNNKSDFSGSWNDLTDKPFGEGLIEQSVAITDGEVSVIWDVYNFDFGDVCTTTDAPTVGDTYVITLNNQTHECVAYIPEDEGDGYCAYIGNGSYYYYDGYGENVPFLVVVSFDEFYGAYRWWMRDAKDAGMMIHNFTTKIEHITKVEGIKTLDDKYIPETIARTDDVNNALSTKAGKEHNHDSVYENKEDASAKLDEAKSYADEVSTALKHDLLNGAGDAYDTLKELGDLIDENVDTIEALKLVATGKANKEHTHSFEELEDKPFGEEVAIETMLEERTIEEQSTQIVELDNVAFWSSDSSAEWLYNKLVITFDNVKYELDAFEYDSRPHWGDSRLLGENSNPIDVPFLLETGWGYPNGDMFGWEEIPVWCISLNESIAETPHTLKIEKVVGETIKTHDDKYISSSIARKEYVDENFALKSDLDNIDLSPLETKEDAQLKYDELTNSKADNKHSHMWNDIEDKPFGEEVATEVLVEETSENNVEEVEFTYNSYYPTQKISAGEKCIVTFDGVAYSCTAYDYTDSFGDWYVCLGDSRIYWNEDFEGNRIEDDFHIENVPFNIAYRMEDDGASMMNWYHRFWFTYADENSHTIKIEKESNEAQIKTLDEKFIPDTIARVEDIPNVSDWAKQPTKPGYTASEVGARPDTWMPAASEVGADASGTADLKVSSHNTSTEAHNDIRLLIDDITKKLTDFLDIDDTTVDQLSEVLTLIDNNKGTLESLTTSKINVSAIVDNLITSDSTKVLSAKQGVAIKELIDTLQSAVNGKLDEVTSEDITSALGYTPANPSNYLPLAGGTMTGELIVNGKDVMGGSKIVLQNGKGQITASGTQTLFGFTADSTIAVGHSSFILAMRGSGTRPKYNSKDLALISDIPSATETWTFTLEDGSTVNKVVYVG